MPRGECDGESESPTQPCREESAEATCEPLASESASTPAGALLEALKAQGAQVDVVPGLRADGVRGIFATRDFAEKEKACWVPDELILSQSTCDTNLRTLIGEVLSSDEGLSPIEREVYSRMVSLVAGLILEKQKGKRSSFSLYIEALPSHPPTVNTFGPAERAALAAMSGNDLCSWHRPIADIAVRCIRRAESLWEMSPIPTHEEVEATLHFVLSRMSNMRLIPLCDLANAALPGEENAGIWPEQRLGDRDGCALVTKKPVMKGEEVVIDYNHHDAIGMLMSYGCTLGLERTHSVTRLRLNIPGWLQSIAGSSIPRDGAQFKENEPGVLDDKVLLLARMTALGSMEEVVAAIQAGFFGDNVEGPAERIQTWAMRQAEAYLDLARLCAERRNHWETVVGAAVAGVDRSTLAGSVAMTQYDTDIRLLTRCEGLMRSRAAEALGAG